MTSRTLPPCRGDIWLVNLDPTIGAEIKKTRPAVIISSDAAGKLPIKLIVPITDWKDAFLGNLWHVRIDPDSRNGLSKTSAADALQVRGVDQRRLVKRLGRLSAQEVEDVSAAIAMVVEYA
ncbi:type II toxin-antitoxin system PemK/MazF family toxin [Geotalea toluenoxydans]|uniref:type II toxin-antitoxin system PemK/MazF family toxin n=1 Tax=Geotalea toluenoxydans TaxID=421624 RepID=UPI001FB44C73|nr:type II toxin-antitoxin system PemK/MazF family toxin [Geotalea toluenoxydans]